MKTSEKFTYFVLIIFNIVNNISMQMLSGESCDIDNDQGLVQWYSQVYSFAHSNQNLSQQMLQFNEKIVEMKVKLEETQRELREQQLKCRSNQNEIVIQRRQNGSVDFYRTWAEYKQGFGDPKGEFFIGLDKLHELTNTRPYGLLIVMMDWENQRRYAKYDRFIIGSELEKYAIQQVGAYTGSGGDSLTSHVGLKFTTKDQKNDSHDRNCAEQFRGAWWYGACHVSNLNGLYLKGTIGGEQWAQGVIWKTFKDYTYSLKFVEMILIRM